MTAPRRISRLRKLRLERAWTLAEASQRANLSIPALCAIERGTRKPSLDRALDLARLYSVPVEQLFELVEVPA